MFSTVVALTTYLHTSDFSIVALAEATNSRTGPVIPLVAFFKPVQ